MNIPLSTGLPCPLCQSRGTVLTERRFGQHRWFCGACEHSWVLPGEALGARVPAPQGEREPADG